MLASSHRIHPEHEYYGNNELQIIYLNSSFSLEEYLYNTKLLYLRFSKINTWSML